MFVLLLRVNETYISCDAELCLLDANSGKLRRLLRQFTPYVWTEFDWRPTSSLTRWFSMLIIIGVVSNIVLTCVMVHILEESL